MGSQSESEAQLKQKWQDILKQNGITDKISQVTVKNAMLLDQGMGSERQIITVTFEDPSIKALNLFGKSLTPNPDHTKVLDDAKAFEKEATFLTKYVPAANEFCKRKGLGTDFVSDLYAKCYYGDNKLIVMENLETDSGYTILGKEERHGLEEATFALQSVAKHQAVGYAMIQDCGGPETFFEKFPNLNFESWQQPSIQLLMEPWVKSAINTNIAILQMSRVDGATDAAATLAQIAGMSLSKTLFVESLHCDPNGFRVLGHGDYWYSNMMFKRDPETGKILHFKAIDLQVCRHNSPALDLAQYLFTSVKTDLRQNHFKELLQIYLDVFNKITNDLGHPANLTYETLYQEYRKRFKFGFLMSLLCHYGPGLGIFKNTDMTTLSEWGEVAKKLADDWISKNPDAVENMAKEVVKVVREYNELNLK